MLFGLVFFLSGCRDETLIPDESMFELTVTEVKAVYSVNEEFTIEAGIKNLSNTMFVVRRGVIFPIIGKNGDMASVYMISIEKELEGQESFVSTRTISFRQPGTYTIDVKANFSILTKEYAYSTEIIIVVE
jgi:hypothetical protein